MCRFGSDKLYLVSAINSSNVSKISCCEIDVRHSQRSADPAYMQMVQINLSEKVTTTVDAS